MKRFVAGLLVLGTMSMFVSGCFPKKEKAPEEAAVEAAKEQAEAGQPAIPPAPKDHPAH